MLGDKIKLCRKRMKLTQTELGEQLGVRKNTVCQWEKGTYIPDIETVQRLAVIFGVKGSWLIEDEVNQAEEQTPDWALHIETRKVPVLGSTACGELIYNKEEYQTTVAVGEDVACDFALKCSGDSMINDRIFDGDIAFIRSQPDVEDGQIAVVSIESDSDLDEVTLKHVYHLPEGGLMLQSSNPAYKPIIVSNDTRCRILGKLVAVQFAVG